MNHEPLEPLAPGPRGGSGRRCQAKSKRSGKQCKKLAVGGYNVCSVHGAGTHRRVAEGTRKRPGSPIQHGLRARPKSRALRDLVLDYADAELDLDNTDDALRTIYAVMHRAIDLSPDIDAVEAQLRALIDARATTVDTYLEAVKALTYLQNQDQHVANAAVRIIRLAKTRADTRVKLERSEALKDFVEWTHLMADIVRTYVPPDVYLIITDELQTKLLEPLGVTDTEFAQLEENLI